MADVTISPALPIRVVTVNAGGTPVGTGLTDTELRASPVPISGTVTTSAPSAPSNANTNAHDSLVVKASAGTLFGGTIYNGSASAVYVMFFNATSLPANTAVPTVGPIPLAAHSAYPFDFGNAGRAFTTGIVIAISSTELMLTVTTGLLQNIDAQYS